MIEWVGAVRQTSAWNIPVASLAPLVLTWTLVTPVHASEPAGDPSLVEATSELPLLESEPLDAPQGTIPEGDYTLGGELVIDAPAEGKGQSPRLTIPSLDAGLDLDTSTVVERDEYSTTYKNADGSNTSVIGYQPQNVKIDGEWVPIDTSVERNGDEWVANTHPLEPTFAGSTTDGDELTVSHEGFELRAGRTD